MKKWKENPLRKLARSTKWQNIYNRARDISSIQLFNNKKNLTIIQRTFLYWLNFYDQLYTDLATDEDNISEKVIIDPIRADSYMIWKKEKKKEDKNNKKESENNSTQATGMVWG